jgi:hypothetical protein
MSTAGGAANGITVLQAAPQIAGADASQVGAPADGAVP